MTGSEPEFEKVKCYKCGGIKEVKFTIGNMCTCKTKKDTTTKSRREIKVDIISIIYGHLEEGVETTDMILDDIITELLDYIMKLD
jgi:hypothetical protein